MSEKKFHYFIIAFVVVFTILCVIKIIDLKFNYDFEAFFPNEDNELEI